MKWIKCSEKLPPKQEKFLFHYYYGIGLGSWGTKYTYFDGDSWDQGEKIYLLILWPQEARDSKGDIYEWDENYMIEMGVSWMPLPKSPQNEKS